MNPFPNRRPERLRTAAACAALACATLAGCAVGPDYVRPAVEVGTSFAEGRAAADATAADAAVAADWWTAYGSPRLDALVREALERNPGVEAARHALGAAQALRRAQQAAFFPSVQAGYTPTRTKLAGNLGGNSPGLQGDGRDISTQAGTRASEGGTAPFNGPVLYNFHTAQLSVGYAPDVFGAQRRGAEAAQAQEASQRHEWHAARVTLATQVVASVILDASLREQLRFGEQGTEAAQAALDLVVRQRRAGRVSAQDEAALAGALAALQQALVPLRLQAQQNRNLLRTLLGAPQDRVLPEFELAELQLPQHLPTALPSTLLEQRPDVRMAEASLRIASAQVGIASAQRLPQFDITAQIGGAAAHLSQMFWSGGRFFDITGNLLLPVFDAGAAKHREGAARAELAQAQARYRAVVMNALQNVADVLRALEADRQSLHAAAAADAAAARALDIAQRQVRAGYADALSLRGAQLNRAQAQAASAALRAGELASTAALFQALGGGWQAAADRDD